MTDDKESASAPAAPQQAHTLFDRLLLWVSLVAGGGALAFMTVLTFWNVLIMRKALNAPIQGAEDILILTLVFLVAVAIPFGARTGAHIEIEMLEPYMSRGLARGSRIVVKLIGLAVLSVMAWRLWESGIAATRYGETSQQLLISYEPFYYLLALSVALYAAILLVEVVYLVRGRELPLLQINEGAQ